MKRLPEASEAKPTGSFKVALVAAPPSPEYQALPFSATVVMMPVAAVTEGNPRPSPGENFDSTELERLSVQGTL